MSTLLVAIGGVLGVLARYGASRMTLHTDTLIWSTVAINIFGSFLLGLLVAEHWFNRDLREALGVGLLGGFTTFSPFSVQIVLDVRGANPRARVPDPIGRRRSRRCRRWVRARALDRVDGTCGRAPRRRASPRQAARRRTRRT